MAYRATKQEKQIYQKITVLQTSIKDKDSNSTIKQNLNQAISAFNGYYKNNTNNSQRYQTVRRKLHSMIKDSQDRYNNTNTSTSQPINPSTKKPQTIEQKITNYKPKQQSKQEKRIQNYFQECGVTVKQGIEAIKKGESYIQSKSILQSLKSASIGALKSFNGFAQNTGQLSRALMMYTQSSNRDKQLSNYASAIQTLQTQVESGEIQQEQANQTYQILTQAIKATIQDSKRDAILLNLDPSVINQAIALESSLENTTKYGQLDAIEKLTSFAKSFEATQVTEELAYDIVKQVGLNTSTRNSFIEIVKRANNIENDFQPKPHKAYSGSILGINTYNYNDHKNQVAKALDNSLSRLTNLVSNEYIATGKSALITYACAASLLYKVLGIAENTASQCDNSNLNEGARYVGLALGAYFLYDAQGALSNIRHGLSTLSQGAQVLSNKLNLGTRIKRKIDRINYKYVAGIVGTLSTFLICSNLWAAISRTPEHPIKTPIKTIIKETVDPKETKESEYKEQQQDFYKQFVVEDTQIDTESDPKPQEQQDQQKETHTPHPKSQASKPTFHNSTPSTSSPSQPFQPSPPQPTPQTSEPTKVDLNPYKSQDLLDKLDSAIRSLDKYTSSMKENKSHVQEVIDKENFQKALIYFRLFKDAVSEFQTPEHTTESWQEQSVDSIIKTVDPDNLSNNELLYLVNRAEREYRENSIITDTSSLRQELDQRLENKPDAGLTNLELMYKADQDHKDIESLQHKIESNNSRLERLQKIYTSSKSKVQREYYGSTIKELEIQNQKLLSKLHNEQIALLKSADQIEQDVLPEIHQKRQVAREEIILYKNNLDEARKIQDEVQNGNLSNEQLDKKLEQLTKLHKKAVKETPSFKDDEERIQKVLDNTLEIKKMQAENLTVFHVMAEGIERPETTLYGSSENNIRAQWLQNNLEEFNEKTASKNNGLLSPMQNDWQVNRIDIDEYDNIPDPVPAVRNLNDFLKDSMLTYLDIANQVKDPLQREQILQTAYFFGNGGADNKDESSNAIQNHILRELQETSKQVSGLDRYVANANLKSPSNLSQVPDKMGERVKDFGQSFVNLIEGGISLPFASAASLYHLLTGSPKEAATTMGYSLEKVVSPVKATGGLVKGTIGTVLAAPIGSINNNAGRAINTVFDTITVPSHLIEEKQVTEIEVNLNGKDVKLPVVTNIK